MKHYLVYQITNLINGMIYIGKHVTDDPNDSYMGSSKWLARSIKKHGIEHYRKDILFDFDNEIEMNAKEHELVNDVFVERSDTYNLNVGGTGSWYACNSNGMNKKNEQYRIVGDKCKSDPQYREKFGAKVSAGLKHYYESNPGIMSGERNPMFNRKHSKATRDKLSKNHSGKLNNRYGSHWYTNAYTGESKSFLYEASYPWVKGRNLFCGESSYLRLKVAPAINISHPVSKREYNGILSATKIWDEFHKAAYKSLGEWAREHNVSYQSVVKRFKRFIPIFNTICKHGVPFSSNNELVGVYELHDNNSMVK